MSSSIIAAHLLYMLVSQLWPHASAQECLRVANTNDSFPNFEDLEGNAARINDGNGAQVIVTSYEFQCCGSITAWMAYVSPDGENHQAGAYSIDFQVWRPSPTVEKDGAGNYSLVGENKFTNISFAADDPVSGTPEPANVISVRPGDVMGFFQSSSRGRNDGIQLIGSFSNDRKLWYKTSFSRNASKTLLVGNQGIVMTSTNAGVVLTANISTALCPTPTFMAPPTATPTSQAALTGLISITVNPFQTTTSVTDLNVPISTNDTAFMAGLAMAVLVLLVGIGVIVVFVIARRYHKQGTENLNTDRPRQMPPLHSQRNNFEQTPRTNSINPSSPSNCYSHLNFANASLQGRQYSDVQDNYSLAGASIDTSPGYDVVSRNSRTGFLVTQRASARYTHDENVDSGNYNILCPDYYNLTHNQEHSTVNPEYSATLCSPKYTNPSDDDQDGIIYYEPPIAEAPLFALAGEVVPSQQDRRVLTTKKANKQKNYNRLIFFKNEDIYWTPGSTTSEIYDQLSSKNYREISRDQIRILNHLGSGQFGTVSKGEWRVSKDCLMVAVKQLLPTASRTERVKLLQEAAIMGQFTHPNVVKLYGLVTVTDPLMVCIEYLDKGDLKSYLEKLDLRKPDIGSSKDVRYFFMKASIEIACGMKYLSNKGFVHRDLAARNVLLSKALICKIGDFGLARDLTDDTYYTAKGGGIVPVRWTAPEALLYKKYSSDSDVWSYAMVLFEIWSVGKRPFSTKSNLEIVRVLQKEYCQPPPPGCPRAIYKLMVDCWNPEHHLRPKFNEIWNYLQQPPSKLFYWSLEDRDIGPSVRRLGAPLNSASNLYLDLQRCYSKIQQK